MQQTDFILPGTPDRYFIEPAAIRFPGQSRFKKQEGCQNVIKWLTCCFTLGK
jgi:hypothetical protein